MRQRARSPCPGGRQEALGAGGAGRGARGGAGGGEHQLPWQRRGPAGGSRGGGARPATRVPAGATPRVPAGCEHPAPVPAPLPGPAPGRGLRARPAPRGGAFPGSADRPPAPRRIYPLRVLRRLHLASFSSEPPCHAGCAAAPAAPATQR